MPHGERRPRRRRAAQLTGVCCLRGPVGAHPRRRPERFAEVKRLLWLQVGRRGLLGYRLLLQTDLRKGAVAVQVYDELGDLAVPNVKDVRAE